MTFKLADRVQETTTTSGTGSLALHGAVAGFQSFAATMAVGDTTYYAITDPVALTWEIGLGTFAAGNTLTRTTVLASSHSGAKIALAGNAGTQVWQDMPASVLAALIAAQGTVASVTDGVTTVTNAATIDFTSGATVSNVGGVAAVAISAGSPLEVLGGGGTVTNASTINFTSGGTVSSGGAGVANVAISGGGGGGGSYSAGLGIYFSGTSPTTIGNTGTIVQPVDTGHGISLYASSGTGTINGSNVQIGGGAAGTAGYGGGYVSATGGAGPNGASGGASFAMYGGDVFSGGQLVFYSGNGLTDGAAGGNFFFNGGSGTNGNAGSMSFRAGNQTGTSAGAGDITFSPGTGPVNGNLVITNLGTADPHVLNAAWLGVGNGITLSSG